MKVDDVEVPPGIQPTVLMSWVSNSASHLEFIYHRKAAR